MLSPLVEEYGVSVLDVTREEIALPTFRERLPDQGQIANMGLDEIPSPFLALVEPNSNSVDLVGAGLMTQDVILDRVRIITSIPEGELYD